jgi:hypothetical protein
MVTQQGARNDTHGCEEEFVASKGQPQTRIRRSKINKVKTQQNVPFRASVGYSCNAAAANTSFFLSFFLYIC